MKVPVSQTIPDLLIYLNQGTMGKRLAAINMENTEENRRRYREILFTADPCIAKYISGVVLYNDTLYQKTCCGRPLTCYLEVC